MLCIVTDLESFVASSGALFIGLLPMISLALIAVFLEAKFPRRDTKPDGLRWLLGAALTLMSFAVAMLVLPITALVAAQIALDKGFGLLNVIGAPFWLAFISGFLLYDLLNYSMHVILHRVPFLWRLHRVHHSDAQVDAATTLRKHPLEVIVVSVTAMAVVYLMGVPPVAILAHFLIMQVFEFWQHSNIRPLPGQRRLAILINVPELHEVHHSAERDQHDSNYGAVLSVWDRLFGTLIDDPKLEGKMQFGLDKGYWDHPSTLGSLLVDPIRK
jgi:sterol desaturase/sphingolipid hydroxylase (fatty acid hydroxylase superfamily)